MAEENKRYGRSIVRNLYEIHRSISYRNAYNKLWDICPTTDWSFFSYASLALFDGIFFHAIKVLDRHRESASFFYLYNCNPQTIDEELGLNQLNFDDIELLVEKLNKVRDKTHFHIDRQTVFNPEAVWEGANITGDYFNGILDKLWVVMNSLHTKEFGRPFGQPLYKGEDLISIINAVKSKGIRV